MQNESYQITGGKPVTGEITCYGAKNFATKAMVAACLGNSPTVLDNVPPIGDVDITKTLLECVGAKVEWTGDKQITIDPTTINTHKVKMPDSRNNRLPILLQPILLNRFGKSEVPRLGGCDIGQRNVDFHLDAARLFGAVVEEDDEGYKASVDGTLTGNHYTLPYPSVGATETCLFLSVLAGGSSLIKNAAIEPEIMELITMLRSMGAIIFLAPNREIRIEGVKELSGTHMFVLGDRIEAASWACLACASDGDITVHGIRPNTLGNFLSYYTEVGGGFEFKGSDSIRFYRKYPLESAVIETDVYPGFSTDWQQPFAVLLTQTEGMSVIHETVYENRFGYTRAINKLGAKVQLTEHCLGAPCRYADMSHRHSALIMGATPLQAQEEPIEIPDLRAGLAYVIAAAIAKGTTTLTNIALLERGYGNIVERLKGVSLDIKRVETAQKSPLSA